jgi:hypothetical protein
MMRLKTLGLALVAVFALSAVAASAASAQQGKLTSDGPVTLTITETGVEQNFFEMFTSKSPAPPAPSQGINTHSNQKQGFPKPIR